MDRVEQLKTIQAEALELFAKKNADYGDAFAKYGIIGIHYLTRTSSIREYYNLLLDSYLINP